MTTDQKAMKESRGPFENNPPKEVWVVSSPFGPDFVSTSKMMADDHANECAGEFPENGPYRVCRYVAEPFSETENGKLSEAISHRDHARELLHKASVERGELLAALQKISEGCGNTREGKIARAALSKATGA